MKRERRKIVSVIGNREIEKGGLRYQIAFALGKALVDNGYRVQSGGLGGVMEAVMAGAHASEKYREGDTIALLPGFDTETANEYADIVIPTGLDVMRNSLVANAYAVIGVGGGSGTLCEYTFAWTYDRLTLAFANSGGWSEKIADTKPDDYVRYPDIPEDRVYGVTTVEEAIKLLNDNIGRYASRHKRISD